MKFYFFYVMILLSSIFYIACENNLINNQLYIITPSDTWIYYDDTLITFTTNVNSNEITWFSTKDGYLGNGATINKYLSPGEHEITAKLGDFYNSVTVVINKRVLKQGETLHYLLNKYNKTIHFEEGLYSPCFVTLESASNISLWERNTSIELKKDFCLLKNMYLKPLDKNNSRSISDIEINEDRKFFYIINTKAQNAKPHYVESKVIRNTNEYKIWYPIDESNYVGYELDEEYLNVCFSIIDDIVLPRIKMIWGEIPDIDGDKKISFFLAPSINEEETAIGFFNSNDFFIRDENNIYSNEMDIIYLAIPQENSFSYSAECIASTVAHELTHLITFYIKSYTNLLINENENIQEEIFLDEAISHLTESLCGFSITGGNISNLSLYLDNTDVYSFCKNDIYGQSDSNGQRGAAVMFLSWLFWRKGGITWDNNNKKIIIDNGGIQFLHKLVKQKEIGWEGIGNAYGKNTDFLYMEMIDNINAFRNEEFIPVNDPLTGEPVQLYINMGNYKLEKYNKEWKIGIPKKINFFEVPTMPPYSFILFNQIQNNGNVLYINNSNENGRKYLFLCKR